MAPTLHHWYSQEEAVAVFGSTERPELFCNGQFAVLSFAVLGFIVAGENTDESHVPTPAQVTWRPRLDSNDQWLPGKVTNVWDRGGQEPRRIKDHHIFLQASSGDRFLYAGVAHMGSDGSTRLSSGDWGYAANFRSTRNSPANYGSKWAAIPDG